MSKSDVTDPSGAAMKAFDWSHMEIFCLHCIFFQKEKKTGDDHEIELIQVETVETLEHSLPLDSNGSSSDENGGDIDWSVLDEDQGGGLDADLDSR